MRAAEQKGGASVRGRDLHRRSSGPDRRSPQSLRLPCAASSARACASALPRAQHEREQVATPPAQALRAIANWPQRPAAAQRRPVFPLSCASERGWRAGGRLPAVRFVVVPDQRSARRRLAPQVSARHLKAHLLARVALRPLHTTCLGGPLRFGAMRFTGECR